MLVVLRVRDRGVRGQRGRDHAPSRKYAVAASSGSLDDGEAAGGKRPAIPQGPPLGRSLEHRAERRRGPPVAFREAWGGFWEPGGVQGATRRWVIRRPSQRQNSSYSEKRETGLGP